MANIDPTTSIGKLRLRCGDFMDIPIMPDSVYQSALDDNDGNLPRASILMAQYILASLTCQVRQKLAQVEVYGDQWYSQYLSFIKATLLNPNFMQIAPIPYGAGITVTHPLQQFQEDWNNNYSGGTQSQDMNLSAIGGFTDGTNYGY